TRPSSWSGSARSSRASTAPPSTPCGASTTPACPPTRRSSTRRAARRTASSPASATEGPARRAVCSTESFSRSSAFPPCRSSPMFSRPRVMPWPRAGGCRTTNSSLCRIPSRTSPRLSWTSGRGRSSPTSSSSSSRVRSNLRRTNAGGGSDCGGREARGPGRGPCGYMVATPAYHPPWWYRGKHLQTLWGPLLRRLRRPALRRERIETPDGDFLDLDWLAGREPGAPLVVVLHGLEGSARSHYVVGLLRGLEELGWRGLVVHFRSCGGGGEAPPRPFHPGGKGGPPVMVAPLLPRAPPAPLRPLGRSPPRA